MAADAIRVLKALLHDVTHGFIELRVITAARTFQEWFSVTEPDAAAARAVELREEGDVYFGVAPRVREEGTKDAVVASGAVWADIDSRRAFGELLTLGVLPSILVASGSPDCHHAYWLLDELISPETLEQTNRRLAERLGSDLKATDAPRILRLPGTLNHKTKPANEVSLVNMTAERHNISRLLEVLPSDATDSRGTAPVSPIREPSPPVAAVLALLQDPHAGASGWTAHCPAHDDQRPSLSISRGDDGRCLLKCHAGCATEAIVAALGLDLADLFPAQAGRRSARDLLLSTAEDEAVDLFHDRGDRAYATFVIDGHRQNLAVDSHRCASWLQYVYYRRHGSTASTEAIGDAVRNLAARAQFEGPQRDVHRRVGGDLERLWIDLGDAEHTYIEVRNDGTWKLGAEPGVAFIREPGTMALPTPQRGGSIDQLRPLLNLPDDAAWTVFRGSMIASFHPTGPYFVTYLHGPGGSGKTEAARRLAQLCDPFEAQFLNGNVSPHDVLISAATSRLVGIDNMSQLSRALSDALCVISTGASDRRRRLYTNADVFSMRTKNPVFAIALLLLATRGDLIDRLAPIRFERITRDARKPENVLAAEFAVVAPFVFAGLMDALASALQHIGHVQLPDVPRMADATLFVTAAEHALDAPVGTFAEAMVLGQGEALQDTIQSNAFIEAVVRFMDGRAEWRGSATQLTGEAEKLTRDGRRAREWPNNPSAASRLLTEYELPLSAHGISCERTREPGGTRDRGLVLRNTQAGTGGTAGTLGGTERGR